MTKLKKGLFSFKKYFYLEFLMFKSDVFFYGIKIRLWKFEEDCLKNVGRDRLKIFFFLYFLYQWTYIP